MKPITLLNAFSLNMVRTHPVTIETRQMTTEEVSNGLKGQPWTSAVGHESTASLFSNLLGVDVQTERVSITLDRGDRCIVGQYRGPRLEEGATTLPEGSIIQWFFVQVK